MSLNFSASGKDSLKASIKVFLPADFAAEGSVFSVRLGELIERLAPMDAKGTAVGLNSSLKLKGLSGPALGSLSLSIKNKDLRAPLAASGLSDRTTTGKGENVELPVGVAITSAAGARHVFAGEVMLFYKAAAGKGGKAKR